MSHKSENIDNIIAELYPAPAGNKSSNTQSTTTSTAAATNHQRQNVFGSFDDDDSTAKPKSSTNATGGASYSPAGVSKQQHDFDEPTPPKKTTATPGSNNDGMRNRASSFDDSSSGDDEDAPSSKPGQQQHHHHHHHKRGAVPFPTIPQNVTLLNTCKQNNATLCNYVPTTCPFVLCLKCDHLVVGRQGVQFVTNGFSADEMYLGMRYHYPDWAAFDKKMLQNASESDAMGTASYHCQCSWLTVRCKKVTLKTPLMGVSEIETVVDGEYPAPCQGGYPRWVCKGHPHK